jgi:glycosyltransferase involved in cell wall biosynthesis
MLMSPQSASVEDLISFSQPTPIRVCFMIDRLILPGGTESHLISLIRNLDRAKVKPYLCLLDPSGGTRGIEIAEDCPVLRLEARSSAGLGTAATILYLARFLRAERIDVLQPYFPRSTYLGTLAGRLAGTRRIVRTRNNMNHWMTPIHRFFGRVLNNMVSVTLCNSESARRAILADERPAAGSIFVIENGVDLDRFAHIAPVSRVREPNKPANVGMVAHLRSVKGVDIFVQAAALVARSSRNVRFLVAGGGEDRVILERQIAEAGLTGRFQLLGAIDDIPGFLAGLDLAVLSSRAEGMPNAILEYMAAGRPIVAASVGSVGDLIRNETHGLLVPPEDPSALAHAIQRVLNEPDFAAELGARARLRVQQEFSRTVSTERYERFYQSLMADS